MTAIGTGDELAHYDDRRLAQIVGDFDDEQPLAGGHGRQAAAIWPTLTGPTLCGRETVARHAHRTATGGSDTGGRRRRVRSLRPSMTGERCARRCHG